MKINFNDFLANKNKNKFIIATLITLFILFILYGLISSNFLLKGTSNKINLLIQNGLYSYEMKPKDGNVVSKAITVVEIDDRTIKDKEKGGLGRWQEFKRSYYAKVIDNLTKDGAIVIGIDVLFSEKSYQYKDDDKILADSIKKAGNVILAMHNDNNIFPVDTLKKSAMGLGDISPIVNESNQIVYSFLATVGEEKYKTFAISILDKYYENISGLKGKLDDSSKSFLLFHDMKIPYSKTFNGSGNKEILINYLSEPKDFNKISFVDVYNGKYNPELVKDKIIFIGASATALKDEYYSPLGIIPGVYTHINAVNTILTKNFLHYFDLFQEIILLIVFTYFIVLVGVIFHKKWIFFASLFLGVLIYSIFYVFSFKWFNTFYSFPFQYFISLILAFSLISVYKYLYEDKGKRILKDALTQYLAADLVSKVLDNFESIKLGGDEKTTTIFFSDIEGFTTISENIGTEALFGFLSHYLKIVSDVIMENKGFINKYEGDAVMAIWGAFSEEKRQAFLACKGAIEQQKTITKLNISLKEKYGFEIKVRMGINHGITKVGNIGSEGRKLEYTALGDNVNLASRLEGINKYYNTLICVSESVKKNTGDDFVFRYLDKIKVKGKKNAVDIYELIGFRNEVNSKQLEIINNFERGLLYYFGHDFKKALQVFEELIELGDKPSLTFKSRCIELIDNPPSKDWDLAREFSSK